MSWPSGRQLDGGIDRITLPADVDGALFLCGKHVVGPDPEAVRAQLGDGAVVVSFNQPRDIARYDGYAAWLGSSPDARWLPVPDFHAPPLDEALPLLDEVAGCSAAAARWSCTVRRGSDGPGRWRSPS